MRKAGKMKMFFLCMAGALLLAACGGKSKSYEKGMEYFEAGDYENAKTYFRDAIQEKGGTEPKFFIGYGMSLNHLLEYDEAEKTFSQMLNSNVELSEVEKKQALYGKLLAVYGQGKYEEAVSVSEDALKLDKLAEYDQKIWYIEAVSCFMSGQQAQAEELCDKLLAKDSSDPEIYMLYGGIKKAAGDTDGAVKIYEELIKKDASFYDAYFGLYECYMEEGRDSAAAELLDSITSIDAKEAEEMIAVGKAWYYKGEYDMAVSCFKEAYEKEEAKGLSGENGALMAEAYNQLAGIYMEREEYDKAKDMLTEGLALGNTGAYQNLLRNQVILYETEGEYEKALEAAKEYKRIYPEDTAMKKEISFIKTRK